MIKMNYDDSKRIKNKKCIECLSPCDIFTNQEVDGKIGSWCYNCGYFEEYAISHSADIKNRIANEFESLKSFLESKNTKLIRRSPTMALISTTINTINHITFSMDSIIDLTIRHQISLSNNIISIFKRDKERILVFNHIGNIERLIDEYKQFY